MTLRADVVSERDVKQTVRRHAQFYDIPLVVAIARGGDLPALDQFDLERVIRASRHWERLTKNSQSPPTGQTMKVSRAVYIADAQHCRLTRLKSPA